LQELLKKLVLKDEELDDVVLAREDFISLREEARWMQWLRSIRPNTLETNLFFP
jgi:hypothetical protein